jgi:hypothetical protein
LQAVEHWSLTTLREKLIKIGAYCAPHHFHPDKRVFRKLIGSHNSHRPFIRRFGARTPGVRGAIPQTKFRAAHDGGLCSIFQLIRGFAQKITFYTCC